MRRGRKGGRCGGYTLIELLVAVALLALVGAALVGAFAGGLRVWERTQSEARDAGPTAVALEQVSRDLANACLSRDVVFEGGPEAVTFAVRQESPDPGVKMLGILCYSYERSAGQLRRALRSPGDREDEAAEALLDRVESCDFLYYETGAASGGGWTDSWTGRTNLPAAVRLCLRRQAGGQPVEYRRTVLCPAR